MLNPAQIQGGKAICPRYRRTYTPKEASAAAKELRGLDLSERWWADGCASGDIRTLPTFQSKRRNRYRITEEEVMRVLGIEDQAEPESGEGAAS